MAAKVGQVIIDFLLNTGKFETDLNKATRSFKQMGSNLETAGKAMTTSITLPLVAVGAAAAKMAEELDDGLDTIRAGTGATGKALEQMGQNMRNVMKTVPASVTDVSTAIADLNTRLGITGAPLEAMATQMLNLARVSKTETGPLIAASTRMFGDWSVSTDKQSASLDLMYKVSQTTGIGMQNLLETVVQYGAPLRAFGFSLDQAAALMGKWEKEGVNMETVLAGLRFALGNFAKAGKDPKEALEGVIKAIQGAKTESEATAIAFQTFGKRAAIDMSRAIIEGRFNIEDLVKTLNNSKETINSAAADTASFAEKWDIFKNRVMLAAEPLGNALLNAFEKLFPYLEKGINFISGIAEKFSQMPEGIQLAVIGFAGLVAAMGPLLMMVGSMATGIGSLLSTFKLVTGGAGAFGGALSALGAVAAAIGAFWVGWKLGELLRNFEWVRNAADGFANSLVKLGVIGPSSADQLKNLERDTSLLAARLKEAGVNVDRMAGESIPAWNARVNEAIQAHKNLTPKLEEHKQKLDASKSSTAALGTATTQLSDEMQKLQKSIGESLRPMDAMNTKIQEAMKAGFAKKDLVKLWADEILNAANKQEKLTGQISDSDRELRLWALQVKQADRDANDVSSTVRVVGDRIVIMSAALENSTTSLLDNAKAIDEQKRKAKEAADAQLIDFQPAIRDTDDLLLNHGKLLIDAGDKAKEAADKGSQSFNALGTAIGNALTQLTDKITDKVTKWAGPFQSFAKAALQSLLSGLFNPLMNKLGQVGNALGNWLGGLFGGGGGGGSLWGNIKSIFSGGSGGGGIGSILGGGSGGGGGITDILGGLFKGGGSSGASGWVNPITGAQYGGSAAAGGKGLFGGLFSNAGMSTLTKTLGAIGGAFSAFQGFMGGNDVGSWASTLMGGAGFGASVGGPIGAAVGAAVSAAAKGIKNLVGKIQGPNSWEALQKEIARDYGGVTVGSETIKQLSEGMGVTEKEAWGVRKNLSISPAFLAMIASAAEQQGKQDAFLKSLEKVGTSWGEFNFRTPFEEGLASGNFAKLNDMWSNVSNLGDAFDSRATGGQESMWLAQALETMAEVSAVPKEVNITSESPIALNVYGAGEDLMLRIRAEVIPILIQEMTGGNSGLREAIVKAYETTAGGFKTKSVPMN